MDYTNNGLLAKVFLIDYGAFLRDIPYHCIHALPFKYSVNVLDSQAFKIALFGVNPRGIKIGVKHCSFVYVLNVLLLILFSNNVKILS